MKRIKELKGFCQLILDQRSDIEEFLLESLDYHKKILKDEKSFQEADNAKALDFSTIEVKAQDLILKYLFAKMNSGEKPLFWRESQKKLFEEEDSSILKDQSSIKIVGDI